MPIDPELREAVARALDPGAWDDTDAMVFAKHYEVRRSISLRKVDPCIALVVARCAEVIEAQAGLLAMASDDYDAGWHAAITVAVDAIRALAPQEASR